MKKIFLLLISLILISCSDSDDSDEFARLNFDQNTFEKNRQLWENSGIKDYTFIQEYSSSSVGRLPKLITVVIDGTLDTIYSLSNLGLDYHIENYTNYKTIDDVFQFIEWSTGYYEDIINSNQSNMKGAEFAITYDETYHYPTEIKCSGYYSVGVLGGLNVRINISDFEIN